MTPAAQHRLDELHRGLTNQPPGPEQIERMEQLRKVAKTFGTTIIENTPPGRDQSIALTALEDCVMRAIRAIALEPAPEPTPAVSAAPEAYHDGAPAA